MIAEIENWIDKVIADHKQVSKCCASLPESITRFFPAEFLNNAIYVETRHIPLPHFAGSIPGARDFLSMQAQGITYKNTYFLLPGSSKSTHLHELVHVAQWSLLGAKKFIEAYIAGVQEYGYRDSPLEVMAYDIQAEFDSGCDAFDIPSRVKKLLG